MSPRFVKCLCLLILHVRACKLSAGVLRLSAHDKTNVLVCVSTHAGGHLPALRSATASLFVAILFVPMHLLIYLAPDNGLRHLQDMSAGENLRLQHLFEDSMSTLTTAVETLSHSLAAEITALRKCVRAVTQADEDDAAVRLVLCACRVC